MLGFEDGALSELICVLACSVFAGATSLSGFEECWEVSAFFVGVLGLDDCILGDGLVLGDTFDEIGCAVTENSMVEMCGSADGSEDFGVVGLEDCFDVLGEVFGDGPFVFVEEETDV